MKLVELDVLKFLDVVDSNSPAPGGGSVSALASSLGASLARMVAHLSFGKKKYEALPDDVKTKFVANFDELLKIKNELNDLIDRDSEAYNTVMAAYKLPKETDEEKAARSAEIQKSLKYAIQTPYDIVVLSGKAISLLGEILANGNQNAITDIGVGTMLLMVGLEGGILNVKVNLSSIKDAEYVEKITKEIYDIKATAEKEKDRIMGMLHRNITEKVYEKFAPEMREDWDIDGLNEYLKDFYVYEEADDKAYLRSTKEEYAERIYNALVEQYNNKEAELGSDLMRKLEKHILFDVVDNRWRGHLKSLDALRESIYLRAYGQRDPVTEYKLISSQIFEEMIATIQEQATSFLFKVVVNTEPVKDEEDEIEEAEIKEVNTENTDGLCPCGSGKPYEKCCGR